MEGLMLLPKRLLFVFLFSLACINKADQATDMIRQGENTRDSGFAYFTEDKFSFLNITALVKRVVENSLSCAFSCLNNLACFSFNLAAFPDKAGKFTCEILSTDKYKNSENFLPSKTFHHFSIVSPCINLPCKNNGKCISLNETNSYVCACKKIFTGKHCETGDTCPPGFVVHAESCYYVANTSSAPTWNSSRRFCQNLTADLAVIKSEDENRFVYDLLRNTVGARYAWIGLHRKADNKFYWLDDRPANGGYQKWKAGEPNNHGGVEGCGHLLVNGKWNDISCSHSIPVAICQWPI
ncbi:C-type lectin domain family 4 member E-like isoform X1 [Acropora muricata]|uniref:C-type lectin domain family 4 member E-like isoform X1 n=2 Tax=Acropora muricata TaxID=159855 RepID=UPI0034E37DB3